MCEEDGALSGEVFLDDRKTSGRRRTVPLTDGLCRGLLPYAEGQGDEEPVFSMSYQAVDRLWREARSRAGLDGRTATRPSGTASPA